MLAGAAGRLGKLPWTPDCHFAKLPPPTARSWSWLAIRLCRWLWFAFQWDGLRNGTLQANSRIGRWILNEPCRAIRGFAGPYLSSCASWRARAAQARRRGICAGRASLIGLQTGGRVCGPKAIRKSATVLGPRRSRSRAIWASSVIRRAEVQSTSSAFVSRPFLPDCPPS